MVGVVRLHIHEREMEGVGSMQVPSPAGAGQVNKYIRVPAGIVGVHVLASEVVTAQSLAREGSGHKNG